MLIKITDAIYVDPMDISTIRVLHQRLVFGMKNGGQVEAEFSYDPDAEKTADDIRRLIVKAEPPRRQNQGDTCVICQHEIPEAATNGCGRAKRKGEYCPASDEIPF